MYWMTRCDDINAAAFILSVLFGVGAIMGTMCAFIELESAKLFHKMICVFFILMFFVSIAARVFVPTTKEMVAIYVVPKIANSETVHELGEGVVTLAREWLEELRPAKKEGGAK